MKSKKIYRFLEKFSALLFEWKPLFFRFIAILALNKSIYDIFLALVVLEEMKFEAANLHCSGEPFSQAVSNNVTNRPTNKVSSNRQLAA